MLRPSLWCLVYPGWPHALESSPLSPTSGKLRGCLRSISVQNSTQYKYLVIWTISSVLWEKSMSVETQTTFRNFDNFVDCISLICDFYVYVAEFTSHFPKCISTALKSRCIREKQKQTNKPKKTHLFLSSYRWNISTAQT